MGLVILFFGRGYLFGKGPSPGRERVIHIEARRYAYEPGVIRVNKNDRVRIRLTAKDVTHGFYLEGYDLDAKVRSQYPHFWVRHPSQHDDYRQVEEISFVASRTGKFRYRCSITCGSFHPFMQGELIVAPNLAFPASIALTLLVGVGFLFYWWRKK